MSDFVKKDRSAAGGYVSRSVKKERSFVTDVRISKAHQNIVENAATSVKKLIYARREDVSSIAKRMNSYAKENVSFPKVIQNIAANVDKSAMQEKVKCVLRGPVAQTVKLV